VACWTGMDFVSGMVARVVAGVSGVDGTRQSEVAKGPE